MLTMSVMIITALLSDTIICKSNNVISDAKWYFCHAARDFLNSVNSCGTIPDTVSARTDDLEEKSVINIALVLNRFAGQHPKNYNNIDFIDFEQYKS